MTHGGKDANVAAAAQELDDAASYKEAKSSDVEKRSVRKRTSGSGSVDLSSGKAKDTTTVEDVSGSPTTESPKTGVPAVERADDDVEVEAEAEVNDQESSIRGVDEDAGPKDFYHPASVEPQPVIWIPRDPLGLGEAEERAIRAAGIRVSTRDAVMDAKGHVDIEGPPPESDRD